jgi:hypothetical protein
MNHPDLIQMSISELTSLVRACYVEVRRRDPDAAKALHDLILTEAERLRIAQQGMEQQAIDIEALQQEQPVCENLTGAQRQYEQDQAVIRRAAELCGMDPRYTFVKVATLGISTHLHISAYACWPEVFALVYYNSGNEDRGIPVRISTTKDLVRKKKELLPYCADITTRWENREWDPNDFLWED